MPAVAGSLMCNGVPVESVMHVKFLGVFLDPHLSWNYHISSVSRKIAKYAPIIYRIRNLCTPLSLKIIYHCLVYANLIYFINVCIA